MFLSILVSYALILYYIYYLEQEKCKCVMTWHHNYIKYILFITAFIFVIAIIIDKSDNQMISILKNYNLFDLVFIVTIILIVIWCYAFYTYVGNIDKSNCNCIRNNIKLLHNIMYYTRYIIIFTGLIICIQLTNVYFKNK